MRYCSSLSYAPDNDADSHYVTVALPKMNAQIYKESEHVTHLKRRTTFDTDPYQYTSEYGISDGGYQRHFFNSMNENNHNNYVHTDDEQPKYLESGYVDEESSKYHKQFKKRRGSTQQFKHIPKSRITEYTSRVKVYNPYNERRLSVDDDYFNDNKNMDLFKLYEEYADDNGRSY
ncbi:unnamed protein product [Heterobilharzia americana]|nr:unnamed protein product [Heterobilharzia americana]